MHASLDVNTWKKEKNKQIIGSYSNTRINMTEISNLERVRSRNQSPR